MELKKRRRADKCDVARCRKGDSLAHGEYGGETVKMCPEHWAELEGETGEAPAAAPPSSGEPKPYSREGVELAIGPIREETEQQIEQLASLTLRSQKGFDAAAKFLKQTKGKLKQLEQMRTSATKPLLDAKRNIDGWFKPTRSKLEQLEQLLKGAMSDYAKQAEADRQAHLEAGNHDEALAVSQPTAPEGIQMRTVWKFEIVDAAAIPVEYLVVDTAKIQRAVNEHKDSTDIPGVRVFTDTTVAAGSE